MSQSKTIDVVFSAYLSIVDKSGPTLAIAALDMCVEDLAMKAGTDEHSVIEAIDDLLEFVEAQIH